MSALTIEAKTFVIPAPIADETQKRFENEVVGTPTKTFTQSVQESLGSHKTHHEIGFQPPAEREAIDALLEELHTFLNPGKPGGIIASDDQLQMI